MNKPSKTIKVNQLIGGSISVLLILVVFIVLAQDFDLDTKVYLSIVAGTVFVANAVYFTRKSMSLKCPECGKPILVKMKWFRNAGLESYDNCYFCGYEFEKI
jgi:predicted RNA-binding Zn-ribbon protein involved in translation (DUF1610 family)